MDTFWQDLRFGGRTLGRNPGFAAVAVLTLALGVGANAAIFSVVNAVLLRPLPWSEPDRAVMIWSRWTAFDKTWVATARSTTTGSGAGRSPDVAAWSDGQVNLTGDGEPERVSAGERDREPVLDARRVADRRPRVHGAGRRAERPAASSSSGFGLWQRRYAGDPSIVGRSIQINGDAFEVVGIMPPDFVLPTDFQNPAPSALWTPAADGSRVAPITATTASTPPARLKPGATVAQAPTICTGSRRR